MYTHLFFVFHDSNSNKFVGAYVKGIGQHMILISPRVLFRLFRVVSSYLNSCTCSTFSSPTRALFLSPSLRSTFIYLTFSLLIIIKPTFFPRLYSPLANCQHQLHRLHMLVKMFPSSAFKGFTRRIIIIIFFYYTLYCHIEENYSDIESPLIVIRYIDHKMYHVVYLDTRLLIYNYSFIFSNFHSSLFLQCFIYLFFFQFIMETTTF